MKTRLKFILLLLLLPSPASLWGNEPARRPVPPSRKVLGSPSWTRFNINRLSSGIFVDGRSDQSPASPGNLGDLFYPKGSGRTAGFAAGPLWGARLGTGGSICIGGANWNTNLEPGRILAGMQPESPDLPKNRIYRVRPDVPPGNRSADVSSEVNDGEGSADVVYDQYHKDWNEWPWEDGAPFDDRNGNGRYDPESDIPGVPAADQTIWSVANDARNTQLWGTQSLGIEMQVTIWGYRSEGALGYTMFRRYLLINRNTIQFDSMFVSMWSDFDLGNGNDDLVGCDTTRSLAFQYNGQESDKVYAPLPPPAVGLDFFQGPIVNGEESDSAIFGGKKVPGKRNLPMTTFYAYTNTVSDPMMYDPIYVDGEAGALMMYRFLQGLIGFTGEPYVNPETGGPTKYPFPGDPENRNGWLDGTHGLTFGDRRFGIASGPFTILPGDTQEVVVGEICAGAIPGCDRLSAVSLLKYYDDQAQLAYNNFFAVPRAPTPPVVTSSALENEIILSWGSDPASIEATEGPRPLGYAFQGYNVYQLPSASASLSEAKRLRTFDVIDAVGKIIEEEFDPVQGAVLPTVKQYGSDSGIERAFRITTDRFRNDLPLVNGTPYYFTVTAYNFNPAPRAVPASLETSPIVMTVVPHSVNPGIRYAAEYGDTVTPVIHTTVPGLTPCDGEVLPLVIDPTKLTGHQYAVSFDTVGGEVLWNLRDATSGVVRLSERHNQTGDGDYLTVDGIQVKVIGPPAGMKGWEIPSGTRRWTWAGVTAQIPLEQFNGTIGSGYTGWGYAWSGSTVTLEELKNVLIKLAATDTSGNLLNPADTTASFAYRYLRRANDSPARAEFAPYIVNPGTGFAYQDYTRSLPFAAYNVEKNPPQRLMVGYLENNVADGSVDGKYWPPDGTTGAPPANDNGFTTGPREWFFIFDVPYSATADPSLQVDILNTTLPLMYVGIPARRGNVAFASGDELLLLVNHVNWPGNTFSFMAPQNTVGNQTLARMDVERINVFPNPYYGVNPLEPNKYERFVTLNHLPGSAVIRIFNLAGVMVRRITHESDSQFERWDLKNESGLPVGSGLYIVHIDMPALSKTKILKLAIVQEQQILDRY